MKSVIVHYQELALKGKNRPWFITRLVRNMRAALADLDVAAGARPDGPDRGACSGRTATWDEVRDASGARVGHRQLRARRRASPLDLDAIADGDPRAISGRTAAHVPRRRRGAPTSGFRCRRRRSSAMIGGRVQEATGWPVDLDEPGVRRSTSRSLTNDAFYSFGKERGRRRPADRHERQASLCLLSGGIDSPVAAWRDDAPRLPRALRALSQLSDPVARVAGQGARARARC